MLNAILSVGVALLAGLLLTRLFTRLKLPDVTAYLVAGVLVGPYVLGRLGIPGLGFTTPEQVDSLRFLSDIALGFIAFAIGSEFRMSSLKHVGRQVAVVAVVQACFTSLLVCAALFVLHLFLGDSLPVPMVLTLSAIAAATAPAATLMVVRQYKAKGVVTEMLLPVVALDDAVGLVIFAVNFGVAMAMVSGTASVGSMLAAPILEIVVSLVFGAVMGYVLTFLERFFNSNKNRLCLMTGMVVLTVGFAQLKLSLFGLAFGMSPLLVCMMLGTVFCNACPLSEDLMEQEDHWTAPIYTLFFVISGAALKLDVFRDGACIGIGAVYILSRCLGKYFGAWLGTGMMRCDHRVRKYLGVALFPQAGVALGMCLQATALGAQGQLIRSIILFSVLVYELTGPMLTKIVLTKSGDIQPKSFEVANRRKLKLEAAESKK
jgi:Kef-type K+ transport system membrane component KefB